MPPVHSFLCRLVRGCSAVLPAMCGLAAEAGSEPIGPERIAPVATVVAEPAYLPPTDGRELLAVDEPMRRYFAARVDRRNAEGEMLRQIVDAIIHPAGLNFTYEAEGIYDAREAFRRRRGSCVSFAFLVVAVARDFGLEVEFQEMDTLQRWNRIDRFIATIRHTNVRLATWREVYVVDLRPDFARAERTAGSRYVVPDARAIAHFYSTAGFFRLVGGDTAGALRLMNLGAEYDPRSRIVWANLGNAYADTGDLTRARACLEQSLRIDSYGELALVCLVDVLRRQGGAEELKLADKHERRAQHLRLHNPYFHYHLAGRAQGEGDWASVERHLRQAIRLKDDEPLFHELLVEALHRLGRAADAQRAQDRLEQLRARLAGMAQPVR